MLHVPLCPFMHCWKSPLCVSIFWVLLLHNRTLCATQMTCMVITCITYLLQVCVLLGNRCACCSSTWPTGISTSTCVTARPATSAAWCTVAWRHGSASPTPWRCAAPASSALPSRWLPAWRTSLSASLSTGIWLPGTAWWGRTWWSKSPILDSRGTCIQPTITKRMRMTPSPSAGCPLSPFSTTATPQSLTCGPTAWCCGRSSPTACSPTTGWLMRRSSTMWGMGTSSPARTIVRWSSTTWCACAGASCLLTGQASPASTASWNACTRGLWPPCRSEGWARWSPVSTWPDWLGQAHGLLNGSSTRSPTLGGGETACSSARREVWTAPPYRGLYLPEWDYTSQTTGLTPGHQAWTPWVGEGAGRANSVPILGISRSTEFPRESKPTFCWQHFPS